MTSRVWRRATLGNARNNSDLEHSMSGTHYTDLHISAGVGGEGNQGQEPRKGGFSKGVSAESSVRPEKTTNTQGYWTQQYMWHSAPQSREASNFQKTSSKNVFS